MEEAVEVLGVVIEVSAVEGAEEEVVVEAAVDPVLVGAVEEVEVEVSMSTK